MYCPSCGKAVRNHENYCTSFGARLNNRVETSEDRDLCYAIAGALIPLVGFILYFVYENKCPSRAKVILKGTLVGLGVRVALSFVVKIINTVFAMLSFGSLLELMF